MNGQRARACRVFGGLLRHCRATIGRVRTAGRPAGIPVTRELPPVSGSTVGGITPPVHSSGVIALSLLQPGTGTVCLLGFLRPLVTGFVLLLQVRGTHQTRLYAYVHRGAVAPGGAPPAASQHAGLDPLIGLRPPPCVGFGSMAVRWKEESSGKISVNQRHEHAGWHAHAACSVLVEAAGRLRGDYRFECLAVPDHRRHPVPHGLQHRPEVLESLGI